MGAIFAGVVTLFALGGCASIPGMSARDELSRAEQQGFVRAQHHFSGFDVVTLHRGTHVSRRLVVYIEGDGRAWISRTRLSADPTPRNPVSLKLALKDPSTAVLYIGRPCQYLRSSERGRCDARYWSSHRYGRAVVDAINQIIDGIAVPGMQVGLVGYSGGGTLAALVAATREDAAWLVTLAANLDHRVWTREHGLSPLVGSLNPPDFALPLKVIPQFHLSGTRDRIVPVAVLKSYLAALGNLATLTTETVANFDHACCWEGLWPDRMCRFPPARGFLSRKACKTSIIEGVVVK